MLCTDGFPRDGGRVCGGAACTHLWPSPFNTGAWSSGDTSTITYSLCHKCNVLWAVVLIHAFDEQAGLHEGDFPVDQWPAHHQRRFLPVEGGCPSLVLPAPVSEIQAARRGSKQAAGSRSEAQVLCCAVFNPFYVHGMQRKGG